MTEEHIPQKKEKFLSFRVSAQEYARIEEERTKFGYKTLSAFAIDRMTGKEPAKYTPYNPDTARLFADVESSLEYATRLEKRVLNYEFVDLAEELAAEIRHFKVFVARKAEALLLQVREDYFKSK